MSEWIAAHSGDILTVTSLLMAAALYGLILLREIEVYRERRQGASDG